MYGLTYPQTFLNSLPVLNDQPDQDHSNANPARTISPETLSSLHLSHTLSHPPDHVLFPFLHGVERPANGAGNAALEGFFLGVDSGSSGGELSSSAVPGVAIPRFRGLLCVVAEEDLDKGFDSQLQSNGFSSEEEFTDSEEDEDMQVDPDTEYPSPQLPETPSTPFSPPYPFQTIHIEDGASSPVSLIDEAETKNTAGHMHPVHDRRTSSASTCTFSDTTTAYSDSNLSSPILTDDSVPALAPPTLSASSSLKSLKVNKPPSQLLTCTFRPCDILRPVAFQDEQNYEFMPPNVPDGISLRNFGIQVPIFATLSDIVVYSPKGITSNARLTAERLRLAIGRKFQERKAKFVAAEKENEDEDEMEMDMELETPPSSDTAEPASDQEEAPVSRELEIEDPSTGLLRYNVFVLDATAEQMRESIPHLMVRYPDEEMTGEKLGSSGAHTDSTDGHAKSQVRLKHTTIDFARREKEEMRDLTRASEIVSIFPSTHSGSETYSSDDFRTTRSHWDPSVGQIFLGNAGDVPLQDATPPFKGDSNKIQIVDAHDSESPLNASSNLPSNGFGYDICVECHDLAPLPTIAHMRNAEDHLAWIDGLWADKCHADGLELTPRPPANANAVIHLPLPSSPPSNPTTVSALISVIRFLEKWIKIPAPAPAISPAATTGFSGARRWSSVSNLPPFEVSHAANKSQEPLANQTRTRSFTSPHNAVAPGSLPPRSRPLKVLIYSADGYTESSVPALCLLMALSNLTLPEAYLTLQVEKKRSFFVYESDLTVLRKVEARVKEGISRVVGANRPSPASRNGPIAAPVSTGRPSAKSISFAHPLPASLPSTIAQPQRSHSNSFEGRTRPRASTSPWLPSIIGDHQSWFNDPRFDGSFPSRVLPFLYLGNLNHASNVYMLHALGITHVVSVGECALIPPPSAPGLGNISTSFGASQSSAMPGKTGHGSLWIEEREGRINVLDIQGVCDDGIDTLEPQLEPICDWIEKARAGGGTILIHCRVGVSRSATVTIAYVMKHLSIPLVDAYLIVRSRRLSVLIQPNMRLLYNLCGWEIKLARLRAGAESEGENIPDKELLQEELGRTLVWPYLAKEVHALNAKYLH